MRLVLDELIPMMPSFGPRLATQGCTPERSVKTRDPQKSLMPTSSLTKSVIEAVTVDVAPSSRIKGFATSIAGMVAEAERVVERHGSVVDI